MIAEAGQAALWLAAALALVQALFAWGAFTKRAASLEGAVRPVAVGQGAMALLSFGCLILLFWRTDLSVALVALNSHPLKPALYRFADSWGNQEGSMLLWVALLGGGGAAFGTLARRLDARTRIAAMGALGVIALGFYAFLLFASNPFARLDPPARNGLGLDPLLESLGLALQPPMLALGYAGLSIVFAIAAGALVTRQAGPALARAMRPWVLGAWVFLTLGIAAVAHSAYSAFGPGGLWFWNPVENTPLIPWLAATALVHLLSMRRARRSLSAWRPIRRRRGDVAEALARLRWPIGVAAVLLVTLVALGLARPVLPILALALAAGLATASAAPVSSRTLRRTPLSKWGMIVAHLGASIAMAGLACESAFSRELLLAARGGETRAIGPWRVRFVGVEPVSGANYTAIRGIVLAAVPGTGVHRLAPEARTFWRPPAERQTAALLTRNFGQLSVLLARQDGQGRWQLRISWKPYVTLIWLGGGLVALGGALSLFGRWSRERRLHERKAYA